MELPLIDFNEFDQTISFSDKHNIGVFDWVSRLFSIFVT